MMELRSAILATLAFYDALSMPLTLSEVYRFLINPARLSDIPRGLGEISLDDIRREVDQLVAGKIIIREQDLYVLAGRAALIRVRRERLAIAQQKWEKFIRISRWLALAPYVRAVFASGSLAMNNTDTESDFDVLVIARRNRLYTSRLWLWIISSCMGVRRGRFEDSAPDKLCFNHYITDDALRMQHESLFNAQTYIQLKPVIAHADIVSAFYGTNVWLNNYAYNFKPHQDISTAQVHREGHMRLIARVGEVLLNGAVGDYIERVLKKYQQRRIANNPITYESGGRIVFTDTELEFHPRSFERTVLAKYKSALVQLNIRPVIEERDSGLRP